MNRDSQSGKAAPSGETMNGETVSLATWRGILEHVGHARRMHPWPPGAAGGLAARALLRALLALLLAAVRGREPKGVRDRALDCIAVLVRMIEEDGRETRRGAP